MIAGPLFLIWLPEDASHPVTKAFGKPMQMMDPCPGPIIQDVFSFRLVKDGPKGTRMVREGAAA